MNKNPSIVPGILRQKKIILRDDSNLEIDFWNKVNPVSYKEKFLKPFFVVDTFASKTNSPEEVIEISLEDLKKEGYVVTSRKSGSRSWMYNQRAMYCIEKISERSPRSKRLGVIPSRHKIQKDINNNRIRLFGSHAGPVHKGGGSAWINLKKE